MATTGWAVCDGSAAGGDASASLLARSTKKQHRLLHALFSGWTVSTVASWTSGRPFSVRANRDNNFDGTSSTDRVNLIPGANPRLSSDRPRSEKIARWFNTAAFAQPANGSTGSTPRNFLDGPSQRNVNLGLFRDFQLPRGMKLQFRGEATNVFNFVNLNQPENRITQTTFGRISSAQAMRQLQLGLRLSF